MALHRCSHCSVSKEVQKQLMTVLLLHWVHSSACVCVFSLSVLQMKEGRPEQNDYTTELLQEKKSPAANMESFK